MQFVILQIRMKLTIVYLLTNSNSMIPATTIIIYVGQPDDQQDS